MDRIKLLKFNLGKRLAVLKAVRFLWNLYKIWPPSTLRLEKQFPRHDIEPGECHELSPHEIERYKKSNEPVYTCSLLNQICFHV